MRILKKRRRSKPAEKWPIIIYYDDREKKGRWNIRCDKFKFVKKRLKTGDYTFEGFEDIFCIERKANLAEFIANISSKRKYKFKVFLERLSLIPMCCVIVEEKLENLKHVLASSKGHLREKDVHFWIGKIINEYQIPILFYGGKGQSKQEFLYALFDSAWQMK